MKTTSAAQALVMVLAVMACATPAFGTRELQSLIPGCSCDYYYGCAKCTGKDPATGRYCIDQSGCGVCGLDQSLINLLLSVPDLVCVAADVSIGCGGCSWTWEQMWIRDGKKQCVCSGNLINANIDIDICLKPVLGLVDGLLGGLGK